MCYREYHHDMRLRERTDVCTLMVVYVESMAPLHCLCPAAPASMAHDGACCTMAHAVPIDGPCCTTRWRMLYHSGVSWCVVAMMHWWPPPQCNLKPASAVSMHVSLEGARTPDAVVAGGRGCSARAQLALGGCLQAVWCCKSGNAFVCGALMPPVRGCGGVTSP